MRVTVDDIRAFLAWMEKNEPRGTLLCPWCGRWLEQHPTIPAAILPHDCTGTEGVLHETVLRLAELDDHPLDTEAYLARQIAGDE